MEQSETAKNKQPLAKIMTPLSTHTHTHMHERAVILKQKEIVHTVFQPSGSVQAVIFVLIPGNGPGSRVICPPFCLMTSAVL